MAIKLKNNKIGHKIFAYTIILIIAAFSVFAFSFSNQLNNYVEKETEDDLNRSADFIIDQIIRLEKNTGQKQRFSNLSTLSSLNMLRGMTKTLETQMYVFDEEGELLYTPKREGVNVNQLTLDQALKRIEKAEGDSDDIMSVVRPIEDGKGKNYGTIILSTKYSDIRGLTRSLFKEFLLSIIISIIFALIFAMFIQKRIGKPIVRLRNEMNDFQLDKEEIEVVKTHDEIEDLYIAFNKLGHKLRAYNLRQKHFFQNSSHELKSPLMSIQGYAEAIKDGVIEGDEINESLDIIIQETQRLKSTVDEIIYMSKLEQEDQDMEFVEFDLAKMIREVEGSLKSIAKDRHIELNLLMPDSVRFVGDEKQLFRTIRNVVGNGIRYAKTKIDVNVNCNAEWIYIDIIDDGTGFKMGEEEKIFDRFYKGENGGSGIGLALARTVVEKHQGTIEAINNINYGAIFKIKLPIRKR